MKTSHGPKPKRICVQKYDQVICIFCVYNNILQKKSFHYVCDFLNLVENISKTNKIPLPVPFYDKQGIVPQALEIIFNNLEGYRAIKKRGNKNIKHGWAIFNVQYKGQAFLHAVAIVNHYLIDSIQIPKQVGVYPWDGSLRGYQSQQLITLWEIIE